MQDRDEAARLAALRRYGILDTAPEQTLDDIVTIAAHLCGTRSAAVSLVDESRQWFKARTGIELPETSRDESICALAMHQDGVMEVRDASADARFADNPAVTADDGVRFYAGAPLVTAEGQPLGALCVSDARPGALDDGQREALVALSRIVMTQLDHHRLSRSLLAISDALERLSALSSAGDLHDAGAQVTALACDVLSCDGAVLLLADGEAPALRPYGAVAPTPELLALAEGLQVDTTRPTTTAATAVRLGEAILVEDVRRSTTADAELGDLLEMASAYTLPLAGVEGVLLLWWTQPHGAIDAAAAPLIELLGAQAGPHLARLLVLARLRSEASTDALTGLLNRRGMREHLVPAQPGAAVAILDLDHFKGHNDAFGHDAGDEVLRELAASLQACVRQTDACARWGGEEFVVIVRDGLVAAEQVLARLRAARDGAAVTFSGGVARVEPGENGLEALVRADRALYAAKAGGRDRTLPAQRQPDPA